MSIHVEGIGDIPDTSDLEVIGGGIEKLIELLNSYPKSVNIILALQSILWPFR